jgi:hypothetical protein
MNWKSLLVVVVTYLVIFGALTAFFVYRGNRNSAEGQGVITIFKEGLKEMFGKIGAFFKSINIMSPLNSLNQTGRFFPRCTFDEYFTCLLHQEDKKEGSILLNLKSRFNDPIILYGVYVTGDILCNNSEERKIQGGEEFYVKLQNCTFSDVQAKLILRYYKQGSSKMFGKTVEGTLVTSG